MKPKIIDYLPFLAIVLFICTAAWVAGRNPVDRTQVRP